MNFAYPIWLTALLLVPLVGLVAALAPHFRKERWSAFLSDRLRPSLLVSAGRLHRTLALVFLLAAIAALVIAISRPQGDAGTKIEKSEGRNVMIALDLSRSMRTPDVKPDRLAQAKIVIEEMLEAMPNERFGLIGFAGQAYVYAPLTSDRAAVRETVSQIDETWAPTGGTSIRNALRLAIDTLKQTGQRNNALVLISDGEKHDGSLESLIEEAKRTGLYILTVGVGTEHGDYVPDLTPQGGGFQRNGEYSPGRMIPGTRLKDSNGKNVISRLQPDVLRDIATGTNGRFAIVGTGLNIPEMVRSVIKDLDVIQEKGIERKIVIEFYQWLVLPAILFLMTALVAGTRWRKPKTTLLPAAALTFIFLPQAKADEVFNAREAFDGKKWAEAARTYKDIAETPARPADDSQNHWWQRLYQRWREARVTPFEHRKALFQLGRGEAEYQEKHYARAIAAYSAALSSADAAVRSRAHAGIATSLFQQGWFALAAESYRAPETKDFTTFDKRVKDYLTKINLALLSPPTDEGPSIEALHGLITDWSDAVRHWQETAHLSKDKGAETNSALARAYLKRLQELLKENEQQQQQQSGQGQGGGSGDDQQEGEGGGDNDGPPNDGSNGPKQQDEGGSGKEKDDRKPGETPEDQARRKLKENSDLERGPLTPGRGDLREPEKDW